MFPIYPYLNINDLNLDYILKQIGILETEVTLFVSLNAIKYADPIQWNIVKQYEKNTVVIDPLTGTAYISVAPVPSGVALTNTDYWTVVFDLGSFVTRAAQNFTSRWESETTATATFPTNTGEWLVWGDVLYKALTNITAGDTYVVNGNIEHFTIEDVYNSYLNTIANILALVGDLADLTTSDTSSIVNAINSVVTDIGVVAGNLAQEVIDRDNADTNILNIISNLGLVSVKDYGAVGDGVTDDSQAFIDAINDAAYGSCILVPVGTYYLASRVTIPSGKRITFIGENGNANGSNIKYTSAGAFLDNGDGTSFYRICFIPATTHPTAGTAIEYTNIYRATIENCNFIDGFVGIEVKAGSEICIDKCSFMVFTPESDGLAWGIKLGTVGYAAPVQIRDCLFRCDIGSEAHGCITCDYTDGVLIQGCTINSWGFAVTIEPQAGHVAAYTFIDNCVIDNCIYHSILMNVVAGAESWRNHVSNCWIGESGWTDITLESAATSKLYDIQIHDNHHYNSPIALNINSASDTTYDVNYHDNAILNSTSNAIQLTSGGSHIKMHDNIFDSCVRALSGNMYARAEYYHNTEIDCTNDNVYGDRVRAGGNTGKSWQSYTPTIGAGSGTINSYTVNDAKFDVVENRVMFIVDVTVNSATTASDLLVSMPKACDSAASIPVRINNTNGNAYCSAGYATLVVYKYDGDGTITDGDHYYIEGCYDLKHTFDYQ